MIIYESFLFKEKKQMLQAYGYAKENNRSSYIRSPIVC
jgi:hypothetical protein